jgi:zinc D-Ala-D-Ala carboxypeptidase
MQLTAHFTLEEFTRSSIALRKGIDNTPPDDIMDNITMTAMGLERIRKVLGKSMHINSGYRSLKLNAAVGGRAVPPSDHTLGLAADFVCPDYGSPREVCKAIERYREEIGYDKLIMEGDWVHVSFPAFPLEPRLESLTANFSKGATTYSKGIA